MFTERDNIQFKERGISQETLQKQLEYFKTGFPFLTIVSPATLSKGILKIDEGQQRNYLEYFENFEGSVVKFVPASGAATRMFKDLYDAKSELEQSKTLSENSPAHIFFKNLEKYAFYSDLRRFDFFNEQDTLSIIKLTLTDKGLNYGSLPKGLLKFHKYGCLTRTPFEEHLVEASKYTKDKDGICHLFVTISPEYIDGFKSLLERSRPELETNLDCKFDVDFSIQKPSTDTIAVDHENKPFRKKDGSILFRPAGHGALIDNLNEIDNDVVVIKNIDNVIIESLIEETVNWKKILIGVLLEARAKLYNYINALDREHDENLYIEITSFLEETFCVKIPDIPNEILKDFLRAKLNRPIRVCGMVKNSGEPGGGPYIVKDADGSTSLQILESAQIDMNDIKSKDLMMQSTHFNPVDIVCSYIDYQGHKFDLYKYIDTETGFISEKSLEGRQLKAQELPGLWNGAMSSWNTIFVEVPLITFNPVKTVLDLLRDEHLQK